MDVSHLYESSLQGGMSGEVAIGKIIALMKEGAQRDMLSDGFDAGNVSYAIHAGVSLEANPQIKAYVDLADTAMADSASVMVQAKNLLQAIRVADAEEPVVWDSIRMKATATTPYPELESPHYQSIPCKNRSLDSSGMDRPLSNPNSPLLLSPLSATLA